MENPQTKCINVTSYKNSSLSGEEKEDIIMSYLLEKEEKTPIVGDYNDLIKLLKEVKTW